MRRNDRNAGSIKALIVLALLIANIVGALPRRTASSSPRSGDEHSRYSARAHTAVSFQDRPQP